MNVVLGSVAEWVRGINFRPEDVTTPGKPGAVACMRTRNVQTELDLTDVWAVDSSFVRRPEQRLRRGDILVSSANSWNLVGKCSWVSELPWPSTFGGFVGVLRAHEAKVDPRYLYWWFSSSRVQALVRSFGQKTTNISNLNVDRCLAMLLPLPPIEEQRRIAAVLDAADALRAKRRQALAKLDTLTQAIFIDMFGGGSATAVLPAAKGVVHPNGWSWALLSDVARLGTGHTPDRERADYWDGEICWVNLTEIRELDGQVCFGTRARITPEGVRRSSAVVHPAGTVCFSRTASIGFVTIMGVPMTTSQDFVTWTCGDLLNPTYLMHALLMSRETLRASSSGSTHRTIYVRDAERFRVLLPPRELQDRFAVRIDGVVRIKEAHKRGLAQLDALFASLQQRAFRGEL